MVFGSVLVIAVNVPGGDEVSYAKPSARSEIR
jgi:hypothetical protein